MATTTAWLTKKKKGELVDLCEALHLDYEVSKKAHIEAVLMQHLQVNQQLSNNPMFTGFYDSQARSSPAKRAAASNPLNTATEGEASSTRSRRKTQTRVEQTINLESSPDPVPERRLRPASRTLVTRIPSPITRPTTDATFPVPSTSAAVAGVVGSGTRRISNTIGQKMSRLEIREKVVALRNYLSTVMAVNIATLVFEGVGILCALVPLTWPLEIPGVRGVLASTWFLPNLAVLLTATFWSPVIMWALASVCLPALSAALVNIRSTTKKGAKVQVDPFIFAISKAVLWYLVLYKGYHFGVFDNAAAASLATGIGKDVPLINAGIVALTAIWEAIISK